MFTEPGPAPGSNRQVSGDHPGTGVFITAGQQLTQLFQLVRAATQRVFNVLGPVEEPVYRVLNIRTHTAVEMLGGVDNPVAATAGHTEMS